MINPLDEALRAASLGWSAIPLRDHSMKTSLYHLGPVEVTAKWRNGLRTPGWDRLWQRIISTLMQENWTADQDTANAASGPSPSPSEVNDGG